MANSIYSMHKFDYNDLSSIKVVGFDLDQTLYPRNPGIDMAIRNYIYDKVASANDVSIENAKQLFDDAYDKQGLSGSQAMRKLNVENAANVMQLALEEADIAKLLVRDQSTIDLVDKLSKHYQLDIITGSHRSNALEKLEVIDLQPDQFNNIITGELHPKSTGVAFEEWLLRYPDLKAENFIYIGDRVSTDSISPAGYGIRSILVNVEKEDPDACGPQLKSLAEITNFLKVD